MEIVEPREPFQQEDVDARGEQDKSLQAAETRADEQRGNRGDRPIRSPRSGWNASAQEYSAGSAGFTGPRNLVPKRSAA